MKIEIPDSSTLLPEEHRLSNGRTLYAFPSASTELVKIDFLYEAGSAYQPQKLVAGAANNLYTVASEEMDAQKLSEFFDYRGIIVDNNSDILHCSSSFYTLYRHLDALVPVLEGLVHRPAFPEVELEVYKNKRRQKLLSLRQRSSEVARRLFYSSLFGSEHPLGRYANPEDADRLSLDVVRKFYDEYHRAGDMDIIVSGKIDDKLLVALDNAFGHDTPTNTHPVIQSLSHSATQSPSHSVFQAIKGAVQATVRVGRILPLQWDDPDYARFMILTTLLGGYFGSRLMSNLREDKGYTYGIYARTQVYRGVIVFFITADVASSAVDDAEKEILKELQRLVDEPVSEEELDLVRVVMAGDFIRSVDGVFERAARFGDMLGTCVTEQLTENLREALESVTPQQLQQLAARLLRSDQLCVCRAGAV